MPQRETVQEHRKAINKRKDKSLFCKIIFFFLNKRQMWYRTFAGEWGKGDKAFRSPAGEACWIKFP